MAIQLIQAKRAVASALCLFSVGSTYYGFHQLTKDDTGAARSEILAAPDLSQVQTEELIALLVAQYPGEQPTPMELDAAKQRVRGLLKTHAQANLDRINRKISECENVWRQLHPHFDQIMPASFSCKKPAQGTGTGENAPLDWRSGEDAASLWTAQREALSIVGRLSGSLTDDEFRDLIVRFYQPELIESYKSHPEIPHPGPTVTMSWTERILGDKGILFALLGGVVAALVAVKTVLEIRKLRREATAPAPRP